MIHIYTISTVPCKIPINLNASYELCSEVPCKIPINFNAGYELCSEVPCKIPINLNASYEHSSKGYLICLKSNILFILDFTYYIND